MSVTVAIILYSPMSFIDALLVIIHVDPSKDIKEGVVPSVRAMLMVIGPPSGSSKLLVRI